jgi:hypothetical protein
MCEIVILAHIWDAFGFLWKIGCDKNGLTANQTMNRERDKLCDEFPS